MFSPASRRASGSRFAIVGVAVQRIRSPANCCPGRCGDVDVQRASPTTPSMSAWVPGAVEIPVIAQRLAESRKYAAVLCWGAVIRGETTHDGATFKRQVSLSLGRISLDTGTPVLFGVLTCNSLEQAIHRSGGKIGAIRGVECAPSRAGNGQTLLEKLP